MSRRSELLHSCLFPIACALLLGAPARAQPAPEPAEPAAERSPPVPQPAPQAEPSAQAVLSAADQAALQAALAADAGPGPGPETANGNQPQTPARAVQGGAAQSMNPDLSVIADVAAAYFSEDENLQAGGHDPGQNGFQLQQLELAIGSAVDPYFRFDANVVFGPSEVEIEEAYATTLDLPWHLQVRAGQFLTRFGRINPSHLHSWDFVDQPFALSRIFGGEGNRGLGVELSWLTPLPWYVEVVGSATQAGGEGTTRSFFGEDDPGVRSLEDFEYVGALKQFFPLSDDWSLAWGLSGAFGPNATGPDQRSEVYGTDIYLKWRPITYQSHHVVSLHSEWFYRRRHVPDAVLQDADGFVALMWRFAQRWAVAARYEFGSPTLDGSLDKTADYLDPDWTESRHRIAANTTFWPTEFSQLRLQTSLDAPGWKDDPIWAVFLALEVVTGAHGAHPF